MKFNCGESWSDELKRKEDWHRWFAWHPARVRSHDCRWLEWIERKGKFHGYTGDWDWEYRAK